MKGLSGKVALVTGAGGPMGFAVARRLVAYMMAVEKNRKDFILREERKAA